MTMRTNARSGRARGARRLATVGLLALVLLAVGGLTWGPPARSQPAPLSTDQQLVREALGLPPFFFLASGASDFAAADQPARHETWYYPDLKVAYVFVDGAFVGSDDSEPLPAGVTLPSLTPTQVTLGMSVADLRQLLNNEEPNLTVTMPDSIAPDMILYEFAGVHAIFQGGGLVWIESGPYSTTPPPTGAAPRSGSDLFARLRAQIDRHSVAVAEAAGRGASPMVTDSSLSRTQLQFLPPIMLIGTIASVAIKTSRALEQQALKNQLNKDADAFDAESKRLAGEAAQLAGTDPLRAAQLRFAADQAANIAGGVRNQLVTALQEEIDKQKTPLYWVPVVGNALVKPDIDRVRTAIDKFGQDRLGRGGALSQGMENWLNNVTGDVSNLDPNARASILTDLYRTLEQKCLNDPLRNGNPALCRDAARNDLNNIARNQGGAIAQSCLDFLNNLGNRPGNRRLDGPRRSSLLLTVRLPLLSRPALSEQAAQGSGCPGRACTATACPATTAATPQPTPTATAAPSAPVVSALNCSPATARPGESVQCSAAVTGTVTSQNWTAAGGNPASGAGASFSTSFDAEGGKSITLLACNGSACVSQSGSVTVAQPAPMISAVGCSPASVELNKPVSCSPSVTNSTGSTTYTWAAPDGSPNTGSSASFSTSYASAGGKNVSLTACNGSACATQQQAVTVNAAQAPQVRSVECSPTPVETGKPVTCRVSADGTVTGQTWSAPDGNPNAGNGAAFTTSFATAGRKPVSVQVCNGSACATGQGAVEVAVAGLPVGTSTLNGGFTMDQAASGRNCDISYAPRTNGTFNLTITIDATSPTGTVSGRFSGSGSGSGRGECNGVTGNFTWSQTYTGTFSGTVDRTTGALVNVTGTIAGNQSNRNFDCVDRDNKSATCGSPPSGAYSFPIRVTGTVARDGGSARGDFNVQQIRLATNGSWSVSR